MSLILIYIIIGFCFICLSISFSLLLNKIDLINDDLKKKQKQMNQIKKKLDK